MNNYQGGGYRGQPPAYMPIPQIRPVASLEEVKVSPIDFDGSVFYFVDAGNKRIYTKQIGMDGMPIVNLYEQKEVQQESNNYVTKEEFESTIQKIMEKLSPNTASSTFDF